MRTRPDKSTLPVTSAVRRLLGAEYMVLAENLGRLGGLVFVRDGYLCLEIPAEHAVSAAGVIAAWSEGR